MDKKKLLKVIIPICLILIVAGIWIFKNVNKGSDPILDLPEDKGSENLVTPKNQEDFVLEATSIDLDALKEYKLPIIIDFGADSCIPCKKMAPVLKTLNAEMQGKAIIKFDMYNYKDTGKPAFTVHQGGLTEVQMRAIIADMGVDE